MQRPPYLGDQPSPPSNEEHRANLTLIERALAIVTGSHDENGNQTGMRGNPRDCRTGPRIEESSSEDGEELAEQ